jgi:hypothetical protein
MQQPRATFLEATIIGQPLGALPLRNRIMQCTRTRASLQLDRGWGKRKVGTIITMLH